MAGLLRDLLRGFWKRDGFFLAAGLSFYVVICVVPFVLLLIAGGGVLLANETVVREVVTRITEVLPVYRADVEEVLVRVAAARGVSGLLGTVTLFLFAMQLLAATRLVLNRVLDLTGRGFLRAFAFDVGMMLLLTVLFFVTVAMTAAAAWAMAFLRVFQHGLLVSSLLEWAGLVLAVVFDVLLFAVVYRFVPARRVPWPSVLVGGVTAAVLWELAKQLFRLYIERLNVYGTLYGSLGVTIGLVMWVYYSAVVFVVGAVLIRVLEERRARARPV